MNHHTRTYLTTALGVIRACVGATSVISPNLAQRSLGVRSTPADGGVATRMFGVRDGAIALATLSKSHHVRRTGLQLGMIADTVDVATIISSYRQGSISRGGLTLIGGAAAAFAVTGATLLFNRTTSPREASQGTRNP